MMRSEKEIKERILKLSKDGQKKFRPKNDEDAMKTMIQTYLNLGERYGLWWVLKAVKKISVDDGKMDERKKTWDIADEPLYLQGIIKGMTDMFFMEHPEKRPRLYLKED